MKTLRYILSSLVIALLIHAPRVQAQDIDLYSSSALTAGSGNNPNVLFILDNAANWNASAPACTYWDGSSPSLGTTAGGIEQCALANAINGLPVQANGSAMVNIGIMFYNANGMSTLYGCNASNTGGCLMYPLTAMTAANKAALIAKIKAFSGNAQQANNEATAQAMQEAWAYYAGKTGMSGTTYVSPAVAGCQKNYVVFIGNAINNSGSPGDASATPGTQLTNTINGNTALSTVQKNALSVNIPIASAPYGTSAFTCSPNPYTMGLHNDPSGLYADEWARYMKNVDLQTGVMPGTKIVHTYSIGVLSSACKSDYPALLTSMANFGGGKYYPTNNNANDIYQAILRILNEVQAVNSVFASSSLPVSVNAQGTYLNQIYMGMFRPDAAGQPRWFGNLKQYQFIYNSVTLTLQLADATGTPVISGAGTGFISPNAASFWDCSSSLNPWASLSPYTALPPCSPAEPSQGFWAGQPGGVAYAYDLPDGEMVEKGGAAMVMRLANLTDDYTQNPGSTANPRNLYTYCPSGASCGSTGTLLSASPFDRSNAAITDAMLGTGPRTISSITSAATVNPSSPLAGGWAAPFGSGATNPSVSITALAKSGTTVTATVSPATDVAAKLAVGTQLKIATGASKYDCNPCTVTAINTTSGTFTYTNSGGNGTPTLASTASIYANYVQFYSPTPHNLSAGQLVTISGCTLQPTLNGTVGAVSSQWLSSTSFVVAVSTPITGNWTDTSCQYTPNTATVTTATAHGFVTGSSVAIAGATPSGYNGTWTVTTTGANTFTYQYTVAAPLANFSATGATATSTSTTRDLLMRWVRGEDNYGDEQSLCPPGTVAGTGNCPNPAVNIRPSVHGDVLHSRPLVINYGGTTGVVVYYGANDGVYRAINGNKTTAIGPTAPGGELWGFIPSEFYSGLMRLHDNSPIILGPSTLAGIIPTPQLKGYFEDGATGLYQLINANGTTNTAYIYMTMRRGGRLIYALDVSSPTAPKFLWKHSNADAGFSELGQTWSLPKVAMVKGYPTPVVIFAAGYDPTEDTEPPTADTMGRGIYILDAATGALIWKATYGASLSCPNAGAACTLPLMKYSIPSDITLLDKDNDGKIDRLYVGDMGGNVWRVDLETNSGFAPANWQVELLASVGCNTGSCAMGTTPRKFMYPPEVISVTGYDALFVGSGDREHPLWSTATGSACQVTNRLYMLKDTQTGKDGSALTTITEQPGSPSPYNLFNATTTAYNNTLSGYYITMPACTKVVNAPIAVAGFVYFGTSSQEAPNPSKCEEPLGTAGSYKLMPFSGTYTTGEWESGGLPPSPVAGVVNVIDSVTGKLMQVPFCIGCGVGADDNATPTVSTCDASMFAACRPQINVSTSRNRTYWYMNND